jgi:argininosuccinate lyase
MRFDPAYVSSVLAQNFDDAKALFLSPLVTIHYAHLVMLAEREIVSMPEARAIRAALDALPVQQIRDTAYDGTCEDLYFHVERRLADACGPDVAGRLHTARSRNDIDMTMYRMRQREWIGDVLEASFDLRDALIELASRHRESVFAAHTHTQPAQPTTVAHYLLAVIEQLERDARRLRAAYGAVNRCPLGACAITGTGFAIDRRLTSDLLGFDGPTGNTYGSIAAVDDLLEGLMAVATLAAGLGRVIQDLLLWCTAEVGYLRLSDGFVQASSIMPQKRNPVALEHARAIASRAVGHATAVLVTVHNTPFGDVVDTEDDLQPLVAAAFLDARRAVALVAAAMRHAELDVARLASRAAEGGTTLTEMADHFVRTHGLPFGTGHAIAARVLHLCRQSPDLSPGAAVAEASGEVIGEPLRYSDDEVARLMSAQHFVRVRQTAGGPAPGETARALAESRHALEADRAWGAQARAALAAAAARLQERSRAL